MKARKKVLSEGILQEIVRRIVEVAKPEKIILFGSAARGELGPDSDLDFLIIKSCNHRPNTDPPVFFGLKTLAQMPIIYSRFCFFF